MEARVEELEAKVEQLLSRVAQLEAVVGGGGSDAALRPSVGETHHEAPHSPAKTPHAAAAAGSPKASPKKGAKKGVKKGAVSRPPERISKPVEKTGSKKDDGKKDHYFVGTRKIFVERPKALANVMPSAGDPQGTLKMRHVYGYNGRDCRQNAFFLENGKIVFCVAAIGVVMDPVTKEQKFFTGHDEDIQCLAIHPNRRYVATGQRDPKGKATPYTVVWDSETMEKLVKISYHERQVCACSFSGDGTKLFTVGDGDTREAAVWDWQAEKKKNDKPKRMPLQTFVVSKDFVFGIRCPNEDNESKDIYAVSFGEKAAKLFHSAAGKKLDFKSATASTMQKTKVSQRKYHSVAWTQDSKYAIVGTDSGMVCVFSIPSFDLVKWADVGKQPVTSVAVGNNAFYASSGNVIEKYSLDFESKGHDLNKIGDACKLAGGSKLEIKSMDARGGVLLVGTSKSELHLIPEEFGSIPNQTIMQGHTQDILMAAHDPTKAQFATAGLDKLIRVWDLNQHRTAYTVPMKKEVFSLEYSPDGSKLAVGLKDGCVSMVAEQKELYHVKVGREMINVIRYTSNGSTLWCGCDDNVLYKVRAEDGKVLKKLTGHTSAISKLTLSADDKFAITNSKDYEILTWDLTTGERVRYEDPEVIWNGWKNLLGWPVLGIFSLPDYGDGTDVNGVDLSCSYESFVAGGPGTIATGDDFGHVNLFRAPVLSKKPGHKSYKGHSAHVTCVVFDKNATALVSCGGGDLAVVLWSYHGPDSKGAPSEHTDADADAAAA